jgi:hypothetical protein
VFSVEHLNRLAGSLALHGRFIPAERALATSLRLYPKQGDTGDANRFSCRSSRNGLRNGRGGVAISLAVFNSMIEDRDAVGAAPPRRGLNEE